MDLDEAIAAGDGTLHGAIDYWQDKWAQEFQAHAKTQARLLIVDELIKSMKEVIRISYRKQDAWDKTQSLITAYEATGDRK